MKIFSILTLLIFFHIPVKALCAFAQPLDCFGRAIACDPFGVNWQEEEYPTWARATVFDADQNQLALDYVECDSSAGGGGGGGSISGCEVSGGAWWVDCDPFAF